MPKRLIDLGILDEAGVAALEGRAHAAVESAAQALTETEPGSNRLRVVPALWPDTKEIDIGIRGDLSELDGVPRMEPEDVDPDSAREMTFIESIAAAQFHAMERDESVIVLGEDVHRLKGGTVGATKGIGEAYPERLIGTPIAENGFCGMGLGAAVNGLRPIVEIMYADFCLVAADQLFNQAAKVRHMFGGDHTAPLILRARVAAGGGYGSQHSMDPSGVFALWPGWRIIAPTTPFDYVGLFNSAVRCNDPVAIIECQALYQGKGLVPDDLDYCIPFGKARIVRPGSACTVVTCANMVPVSVAAADAAEIDAEVIDSAHPRPPRHGLGDHRGERAPHQSAPDRGADRARPLARRPHRAGGAGAALRLARPRDPAGLGLAGGARRLQGAGDRSPRPAGGRGRGPPRRDRSRAAARRGGVARPPLVGLNRLLLPRSRLRDRRPGDKDSPRVRFDNFSVSGESSGNRSIVLPIPSALDALSNS